VNWISRGDNKISDWPRTGDRLRGDDHVGIKFLRASRGEPAPAGIGPEFSGPPHGGCRQGKISIVYGVVEGVQPRKRRQIIKAKKLASHLIIGDLGDKGNRALLNVGFKPCTTVIRNPKAGTLSQ
jgi:hypothetical protein